MKFIFRIIFSCLFSLIITGILIFIFNPILNSNNVYIDLGFISFNICEKLSFIWKHIYIIYFLLSFLAYFFIGNTIFSHFFKNFKNEIKISSIPTGLNLYIGKSIDNKDIYIEESGLYQNFLITGTIGSGKTSSAMYPFTKQLISYNFALNGINNPQNTIGMLILDVKGNFYKQVNSYCKLYGREDDLIIIELGGYYKYNPLHKPNLKASVLANRLKTILTLFSTNNQDSYWLDKAEQVLAECIKLCRLYNNGYVNFIEIHKLISSYDYYTEKIKYLRKLFQSR